jgi:hypothetical protein
VSLVLFKIVNKGDKPPNDKEHENAQDKILNSVNIQQKSPLSFQRICPETAGQLN